VVRSDGSLGKYVGGPAVKQTLLTLEGAFPGSEPGPER
jgi:O6-methylguanine-DNA--protein-cysteine methyltransferase